MTDYEVEQRLGYTPCVCAKIDGTWHPKCYVGKTREQIAAGYKRAFAAARRHLKAKAASDSNTTAEFECLGEPSLCTNPRGCACPEANP